MFYYGSHNQQHNNIADVRIIHMQVLLYSLFNQCLVVDNIDI